MFVTSLFLISSSNANLYQTISDWHERGIVLHFKDCSGEWINTSLPVDGRNVGDVMLRILESEKQNRSEVIRLGIQHRQSQGKRHGRYPRVGFMWEKRDDGDHYLVPDPQDIAVMQQIVDWRDECVPWERIYFKLLRHRVKTRDGREWSVSRIRRAYDSALRLKLSFLHSQGSSSSVF